MTPLKTPRTNKVLGAPAEWDAMAHGPCIGLPVVETEDPYLFSYWGTTWRERLSILLGRPVRLCVAGRLHPPVMIDTVRD